jgi:type I restriction enzyme M protein
VLFVQKWNDDPKLGSLCPNVADYNIFFATQQLESKDNGGEKIIARKDGKLLRDTHGHWVIQHDLFNHDGLTRDGIAEAFAEFAKKEKLSFF